MCVHACVCSCVRDPVSAEESPFVDLYKNGNTYIDSIGWMLNRDFIAHVTVVKKGK